MNRAALAIGILLSTVCAAVRSEAEPVPLDRAVVRFSSRETGGAVAPRFVFERELAFEARLEALAEGDVHAGEPPFRSRHVRAALERHVTETVLSSLAVSPPLAATEIKQRAEEARIALAERVGGVMGLLQAARAEGISDAEVSRLLRRNALASLYLDRMVAPMLGPSDAELRTVHRTQRTPFSGRPFDEIKDSLRRWYVSARLALAVATYYEGLRSRMTLSVLR